MKHILFPLMAALLFMGQSVETLAGAQLVSEKGKPMGVKFPDGREFIFAIKHKKATFESVLRVAENSCTPIQRAACTARFPYFHNRSVAIWTKHPTRQGQLVQEFANGSSAKIPVSFRETKFGFFGDSGKFGPEGSTYGELECDTNEWVPWSNGGKGSRKAQISFWDEDFQNNNSEVVYHSDGDQRPSFNAFTARVEGLPVLESSRKILIGKAKSYASAFSGIAIFPIIAYKLQITFASQSLEDPYDRFCQVKMDTEFSKIFETLIKLLNVSDPKFNSEGELNPKDFKPALFESEEARMLPKWWTSEGTWAKELF